MDHKGMLNRQWASTKKPAVNILLYGRPLDTPQEGTDKNSKHGCFCLKLSCHPSAKKSENKKKSKDDDWNQQGPTDIICRGHAVHRENPKDSTNDPARD